MGIWKVACSRVFGSPWALVFHRVLNISFLCPLALPAPFVAALIYIDFIWSMAVPIGELEAFISGPPPSQPHALRAPSVSAPLYINPNGSMAGPGGCAIPTMITIGQ